MNKAFVRYGLLGLASATLLSVGITAVLIRPAHAQGLANDGGGVISGAFEIPNHTGQKVQYNLNMFARGTGQRAARTTFEVLVDVMSPTGSDTLRRVFVLPHVLEVNGRTGRLSLVVNADNLDLYQDGVLLRSAILNGLPPGEPVIDFVLNSQTQVGDRNLIFLEGTTQVSTPDGSSTAFGKSHELSGNVTLIK
jgi:hypothetical protein